MKFGALGPRATKLYIRNSLIIIAVMFLWWHAPTLLAEIGLGKYVFWLTLPLWILALLLILSTYNIGYFGKELNKAIIEDNKEEKENMRSKQPWE